MSKHWCGDWPDGRPGCLGMLLSCGHSFTCASDPAIAKHQCAASWTPVLWSFFLMMVAAALVVGLLYRG